jgi:hypothetical protein
VLFLLKVSPKTARAKLRFNPVRWKLLLAVSLVGGLAGLGLWSILAVVIFGSARVMAQEDWRLLSSLIIPLFVTAFASIFVYRHTSKRRKLQALLTTIFVLVATVLIYVASSTVFVSRLYVPPTDEVRHAR